MEVSLYSELDSDAWNSFNELSKNGTFLFHRKYLEYHSDRFQDASLIVRDASRTIVALLPAHRTERTLVSHGGLTYGGFVVDAAMKLPTLLEVFRASWDFMRDAGVTTLLYKTVPWIYHRVPAEEDRHALYLAHARVIRRGVLAVLREVDRPKVQERRRRGAKKASRHNVIVAQSTDWAGYWSVLSERLFKTHAAHPVHSADEIQLLASRFPTNIKLFIAAMDNEMIAGVVILETPLVARAQYIAASDTGQNIGALDLLFEELLSTTYKHKPFFEFGTSDEAGGYVINRGLIDQKEGYGARVVVHDHYEVDVAATPSRTFIDASQ